MQWKPLSQWGVTNFNFPDDKQPVCDVYRTIDPINGTYGWAIVNPGDDQQYEEFPSWYFVKTVIPAKVPE